MMSFGQAIEAMRRGEKVARIDWQGSWVAIQVPSLKGQMHKGYIYMSDSDGKLFPWNPSHPDMLTEDWQTFHV